MANSTSRFLPTPKKKEREYTEKQQCFLDSLFKTGGDPKKAAEMAGYADNSHLQVVKSLKDEIIDLASEILAQSAPQAAFKLVEVMNSNEPIPKSTVKVQAAQTILDRIGLGKADRIDVNHNVEDTSGALYILPAKKPATVDAEYSEVS